ncbi:MAG: MFS transporter [Bacilli bacterium]|nr:MFS transporter [Bacilli bacterium]MBN2696627.1 MFS transporter [Bacilli bacterium]
MTLWNRNFSIVTIGSFISALGSAAAGIAFGILIYIETGSPLTLALFTIANIVPRVITNFLIGPFIDRNSRRKIIFSIDYFYAFLFLLLGIILYRGYFNVWVFTAVGAFIGIVDTIYQTAFMSLFPEVIPQGYHSKAYSISSLIWPISAAVMAPVAAFFIENITNGVALLMFFNAVTFVVTASIEILINVEEKLNQHRGEGLQFITDLKEGIHYYKKEHGILGIGILFAAFSFVYAASDLLRMPFFVQSDIYTIQHFSYLITAGATGRMIGGIVHYLFKYPTEKKFLIAVTVYISVEIMGATMLYMPYVMMIIVSFIVGLLSVTSFNIRMSATQTYIPSDIRGRVNSTQQLLWNFGAILGALIIGLVAEYSGMDYRLIILASSAVSLSAIFLIPVRMSHEFKKIYNVDV